jgi:hypothetical protein
LVAGVSAGDENEERPSLTNRRFTRVGGCPGGGQREQGGNRFHFAARFGSTGVEMMYTLGGYLEMEGCSSEPKLRKKCEQKGDTANNRKRVVANTRPHVFIICCDLLDALRTIDLLPSVRFITPRISQNQLL